jgi:MFS family permease
VPAHPPAPGTAPVTARVAPVLVALLVAATTYAFTQTLVGPALPALAERLDVSLQAAAWLMTAFLVSASVATPVVGKLGDIYDRRTVLLAVLSIFMAACVLCSATTIYPVVLTGRIIQGVAAGLFPLAYGLVRDVFPPGRVGPSIALLGTTFGVGSGIGLPISGLLVDSTDVRYVFLSGLLALPAAVAVWFLVPRRPSTGPRRGLDLPGCALMAAGLALVLLGISRAGALGVTAPLVLALVAGGLLVLALFVRYELGQREPLVDIRVLRSRPMLATNAATLAIGVALFTNFLLTPQYAQAPKSTGYGFGYTALASGALMLPASLVMLVSGPLSGRIAARFGARLVLLAGGVVSALALGLLALRHATPFDYVLAGCVMGIGSGFVMAAGAMLVVELSDPRDVGVATGVNSVARTAGAALGSVVLASVVAASVPDGGRFPTEGGFAAAYWVGCGAAVLSAVLACLVPRGAAVQHTDDLDTFAPPALVD